MDTPDITRPDFACILHRPPTEDTEPWWPADPGYRTCSGCLDRLRSRMRDVEHRYAKLDPTPGANAEAGGRGSPGFGSRSPASDHVIALRDPRSSQTAKAWIDRAGRVCFEHERPPVSVRGELDLAAWDIAEARGINGPPDRADVDGLLHWIDGQLDWATRHEVCLSVDAAVRRCQAALRPVTGDPRPRYIGNCPTVLDRDEGPVTCGTRLYAPTTGETIVCHNPDCGRQWERSEWLRLGSVLQAAS